MAHFLGSLVFDSFPSCVASVQLLHLCANSSAISAFRIPHAHVWYNVLHTCNDSIENFRFVSLVEDALVKGGSMSLFCLLLLIFVEDNLIAIWSMTVVAMLSVSCALCLDVH